MGAPSHNRKSVGESRVKVESERTSAVWHTYYDRPTGNSSEGKSKHAVGDGGVSRCTVVVQRATRTVKCILGIFFAPTCGCSALANAAASMVQWILKYGVYRILHTVQ